MPRITAVTIPERAAGRSIPRRAIDPRWLRYDEAGLLGAFSLAASSSAAPATAGLAFTVVKTQVPNAFIPINPLGLTITYFREDQAFQ